MTEEVRGIIARWLITLNDAEFDALAIGIRPGTTGLCGGWTARTDDDDEVISCCLLAYPGWRGRGLQDYVAIHDYLHAQWRAMTEREGSVVCGRTVLAWFDNTPLVEAKAELVPLVDAERIQREGVASGS